MTEQIGNDQTGTDRHVAEPQRLVGARYRLEARTEPGPYAECWRATDLVLARPVLLGWAAESGPGLEELLSSSARVGHPGIVAVYDTGIEEGRSFVVTELPAGRTLRASLDDAGPLPSEQVTRIGLHLCAALDAAHRVGLVHGRLAMDSVMCDDDAHTKIGGFGTAPDAATQANDVVAVGRLLYELLCGRPPAPDLTGATPRQVRPGVPPALDTAVVGTLNGSIRRAADLRDALNMVDISADDATPAVVREPTPPMGVPPLVDLSWPPGNDRPPSAPNRPPGRRGAPPGYHPTPVRRRPAGGQDAGVVALTIVAVALAVVATVLAAQLALRHTSAPHAAGGQPAPSAAVAIADVRPFDPPPGDLHEDDARLPLVHDGNPSTVWTSEIYTNRQFGNLKKGVGLYLVLNGSHQLHALTVISPLTGWSAQVYVADHPAPDLAGWGQPVGQFTVGTALTTVPLSNARGNTVLVWITELAAPNRVDIGELTLS